MNEGRRAVALTTGPASSDVPTDKAGRRIKKTALRQAAKALAPEGSRVNADLAEGVSDAEEPGTLSPLRRDDAKNEGEVRRVLILYTEFLDIVEEKPNGKSKYRTAGRYVDQLSVLRSRPAISDKSERPHDGAPRINLRGGEMIVITTFPCPI